MLTCFESKGLPNPPQSNFKFFSLAAVEQLGACGASLLHNLSSSVNLKKGEVVSKVCPIFSDG